MGKTLTSSVKNIRIVIHREYFGRLFEIPFPGTSYKFERSIVLKKFKQIVAVNTLVTNPMEKRIIHFRTSLFKPKVRIIHYLMTRIVLPRNININYIIKDDIIPLWLLTQSIPTNWLDEMFHHMSYYKEKSSTKLLYGEIITRILNTFNIDTQGENAISSNNNLIYIFNRFNYLCLNYH